MRRIIAQTRKELTQIVRDWRTLALALVLPLILLVLNGSAISLSVTKLPIIAQDYDDSPASREFLDAFRASLTFHIVPFPVDKKPAEAFASNTAHAAIIIPIHFGRDMARGFNSPVQLMLDASDANTARQVAGYAAQITQAYNRRIPEPDFRPDRFGKCRSRYAPVVSLRNLGGVACDLSGGVRVGSVQQELNR